MPGNAESQIQVSQDDSRIDFIQIAIKTKMTQDLSDSLKANIHYDLSFQSTQQMNQTQKIQRRNSSHFVNSQMTPLLKESQRLNYKKIIYLHPHFTDIKCRQLNKTEDPLLHPPQLNTVKFAGLISIQVLQIIYIDAISFSFYLIKIVMLQIRNINVQLNHKIIFQVSQKKTSRRIQNH